MNALIELYDERTIENVLGPETFRPAHVIYLCPSEVARDRKFRDNLCAFYERRGLDMTVEFMECSQYKADKIEHQLKQIAERYSDVALDITGGTDAALFAGGMFCKEMGIPAFTYSRKKNRFYEINNAPFAHDKLCDLSYSVEDFFLMAGGTMRRGRVDNQCLDGYMSDYDRFFEVFLEHRRKWPDIITFMQRISQTNPEEEIPLHASGSYYQKGEHGDKIAANEDFLTDIEKMGWIRNLQILNEEQISFDFKDHQIRYWLRDVGSVLELFMYKACIDTGIFQDVISSAVVDWDGTVGHDSVSNEIDVMATQGIVPLFVSCKACEIKTHSINELAILRDRFGGKNARAVIVTTERCNAAARHRAAELQIAVIDLEELESALVVECLTEIMKTSGK